MQQFHKIIGNLNPRIVILTLSGAALFFGGVSLFLVLIIAGCPMCNWLVNFLQSLSAGLFGSALTFWMFNVFSDNEYKRRIIEQMGSEISATALDALRIARKRSWTTDGSLMGADLRKANLQGADLRNVNLRNANLEDANLEDARLEEADLAGANLQFAILTGARLFGVDLRGVNLDFAHLENAQLSQAKLQRALLNRASLNNAFLANANLHNASLRHATLDSADFFEADLTGTDLYLANLGDAKLFQTVMPDGTTWEPDTDLNRFVHKH